ncbi:hypothetical protein BVY03_04990 [bacterium K02(2017)]|nr:hypothetical protein BVY03_04990 [bacterium K02(2017)]
MAILSLKKLFKPQKTEVKNYKNYHFINTLKKENLNQILLSSEAYHLTRLIPDIANKKVLLFNDPQHKMVLKTLMARKPSYLINYMYQGGVAETQNDNFYTATGDFKLLPFKQQYFDVIICPFVLNTPEIDNLQMSQLARLLKNGGRIIISFRHMQLEHMLYNQNPAQLGTLDSSFTQYFRKLKQNKLFIENVLEGCVDKPLKPFFSLDDESDHYQEFKNTPLTLFFRAVKFIRNASSS